MQRVVAAIQIGLLECELQSYRVISAYNTRVQASYDVMMRTERRLTNVAATLAANYRRVGWNARATKYERLRRLHLESANTYLALEFPTVALDIDKHR